MISLEDCIALCGLTEAEVPAIAEHEHLPGVAAAMLGQYMLHQNHGLIVDDVRAALQAGNTGHAAQLVSALRHFTGLHPAYVGPAAFATPRRAE